MFSVQERRSRKTPIHTEELGQQPAAAREDLNLLLTLSLVPTLLLAKTTTVH